jgi:phage N-6-adenine-methyltransferase
VPGGGGYFRQVSLPTLSSRDFSKKINDNISPESFISRYFQSIKGINNMSKDSNKADCTKMGYIGAKPGSSNSGERDSNSWYTPSQYIEMAREVMGSIDLDPFSSESANQCVKAERYFDIDVDAHKQVWFDESGTVFMNPPYGRGEMKQAVETFLANWTKGSISEAIVLVNNATDTKWFQSLHKELAAMCVVSGRIAFENNDGKHVSGNTRGQIFLYFGENNKTFFEVFNSLGCISYPVIMKLTA